MKSKTIKGVEEDFNTTKKQVKSEFIKAKAKIIEAQKHAEEYIAKNPKKVAALAIGLGAAVGAAVTAYWMKAKK